MKLISSKTIKDPLNKCYLDYDPAWAQGVSDENKVLSFKYYIEQHAGLRLDFIPKINQQTYMRFGYELKQVAVVDEPKYLMWLMRWS